jgi:hypothetical protein
LQGFNGVFSTKVYEGFDDVEGPRSKAPFEHMGPGHRPILGYSLVEKQPIFGFFVLRAITFLQSLIPVVPKECLNDDCDTSERLGHATLRGCSPGAIFIVKETVFIREQCGKERVGECEGSRGV